MQNLKSQWLDYLGYVLAENETVDEAFDRLRNSDPDKFPIPRYYESFWDAIRECLRLANENTF